MTRYCKIIASSALAVVAYCSTAIADTSNEHCVDTKPAKQYNWDIRASINSDVSVSGKAGSGSDAPNYSDAFENAYGMGIEIGFRPTNSKLSYFLGTSYTNFDGKTYKNIKFDRLEYTDLYTGIQLHFLEHDSKVDPYIKCELGLTFIDKVKVTYRNLSTDYWDDSTRFMLGVGFGANYLLTNNVGGFLEIGLQYRQAPDEQFKASDADDHLVMPMRLGIIYKF